MSMGVCVAVLATREYFEQKKRQSPDSMLYKNLMTFLTKDIEVLIQKLYIDNEVFLKFLYEVIFSRIYYHTYTLTYCVPTIVADHSSS